MSTFFWVVQNNKPVIDATNKLNKQRKANFISNFIFSASNTKLPHNKIWRYYIIWLIFISIEEKINISVSSWCSLKILKKRISLNKQQIKEVVAYVTFNHFTVSPQIFHQIVGIPMGSYPVLSYANLSLYFHGWIK